jgi:protein RecA
MNLMRDLNKQMGAPMIHSAAEMPEIRRIRSRIPAVDYCLGGGLAVNRIMEYYGPPSSGKTYNAMIAMREFQNTCWETFTQGAVVKVLTYKEKKLVTKYKDGSTSEQIMYTPDKMEYTTKNRPKLKNVYIIDVEGSFDIEWAEQLGLDVKRIIRVIPDTGEHAIDIADALLRDPDTCLVVYDSVGITRAAAEIEKSMEDQSMGLQARFWNRASAKFQAALNTNPEKDVTLILINRAYQKVGLVFGDPEQVGGGRGIEFAKSISLKFANTGKENRGDLDGMENVVLGRNIKVENKKNKTAKPLRDAQYFFVLADDPALNLRLGETDVPDNITELGVQIGLIEKIGHTYKFGRWSEKGRDKWVQSLRDKPGILNAILNKFYEQYC